VEEPEEVKAESVVPPPCPRARGESRQRNRRPRPEGRYGYASRTRNVAQRCGPRL
jgi:hypothetical protein